MQSRSSWREQTLPQLEFLELSLKPGGCRGREPGNLQCQRVVRRVTRSYVDFQDAVGVDLPGNLTQCQQQVISRAIQTIRSIDTFHLSQRDADDQRGG